MAQEKKKPFTKRSLPPEVKLAVQVSLDKKAEDLCVLDLSGLSSFTDYFLIMHGNSSRHNGAVADAVDGELKKTGARPLSVEGRETEEWILLDYGFFVVHVFSPKAREHYSLEKLWGDAPRLNY
jgi:ribosome-associated protein